MGMETPSLVLVILGFRSKGRSETDSEPPPSWPAASSPPVMPAEVGTHAHIRDVAASVARTLEQGRIALGVAPQDLVERVGRGRHQHRSLRLDPPFDVGHLHHTKATHANSTPAVDGKRVVAFFGSEGVYAYSLDGKPLWSKDLGAFDVGPQGYEYQWGTASSPVLFEDKVILQCDQKKGSFLVVLSAATGEETWRTGRDGVSNHSWATPAVIRTPARTQIVCNGWPYIAAYSLSDGKELWRLKSEGDIPVPTPLFVDGLIYVTNAHGGGAPLYAIRPEASATSRRQPDRARAPGWPGARPRTAPTCRRR